MDDTPNALTATLQLLFDGMDDKDIADAVLAALGGWRRGENVFWQMQRRLPIANHVMVCRSDVEDYLEDDGSDEGTDKLTGSDEDIHNVFKEMENQWGNQNSCGELYMYCRDDVIDALREDGHITSEVTEDDE